MGETVKLEGTDAEYEEYADWLGRYAQPIETRRAKDIAAKIAKAKARMELFMRKGCECNVEA